MILGWIRFADKAACGGVVSEGIADNIRMGQPLAFLGARIACRGGCYIAEGHPTYTDNGRPIPYHLHKSIRGCPIYATLNGIDGWEDGSAAAAAERCFQKVDGDWVAVKAPKPHEEPCDEQTHLADARIPGVPFYAETKDGRVFSGRTCADGRLPRIDTFGEDAYAVLWGDEALAKSAGGATE